MVPVAEFVPLPIPPQAEPEVGDIRISIQRGNKTLDIQWPVSSAQACARWIGGEVLK